MGAQLAQRPCPAQRPGRTPRSIPDEELWHRHEECREQLVVFMRQRLREQLAAKGATAPEIEAAGEALNPYALTIVFARRFATYKRAIAALPRSRPGWPGSWATRERPVQIIFAGKAHPQDNAGRELIRQIVHQAREPGASAAASSSWRTTT